MQRCNQARLYTASSKQAAARLPTTPSLKGTTLAAQSPSRTHWRWAQPSTALSGGWLAIEFLQKPGPCTTLAIPQHCVRHCPTGSLLNRWPWIRCHGLPVMGGQGIPPSVVLSRSVVSYLFYADVHNYNDVTQGFGRPTSTSLRTLDGVGGKRCLEKTPS